MKYFFIATAAITAALAFAPLANADMAQTILDLQAQIQALQQQLNQMLAKPSITDTGTVAPTGSRIVGVGFSETLGLGSRGDAVSRLQQFLKDKTDTYPEGLVTGYFGALTQDAVKRFQTENGIDPVGIVGPKTRAKLNGILLVANPVLPPPKACYEVYLPVCGTDGKDYSNECFAGLAHVQTAHSGTCQSALPPPPAPTPPPPPVVPPPATSGPIPTPSQLGLPLISFTGWSASYLRVTISHDPGVYTRSYAIYVRKPGDSSDMKYGPYLIPTSPATTTSASDGSTFAKLSESAWEWRMPLNLTSAAEGIWLISATAVGNGGVESQSSPGNSITLYPTASLDGFLQGNPQQGVDNNVFTTFPFIFRLLNAYAGLRYHYTIVDGPVTIWDSRYITTSDASRAQVSFSNLNNYIFVAGKTYRVRVDVFDNEIGNDSVVKQKSDEKMFTVSM